MPKLPVHTKPFLWGAASGALALSIIGFAWGGWMTGSAAQEFAATQAQEAVVARLAPICVSQFRKDPRAKASLKAMNDIASWQRPEYVKRNGWATMPGSTEALSNGVAAACADVLIPSAA